MRKGQEAFHVINQYLIEQEGLDYVPLFCDVANCLMNISDEEYNRLVKKDTKLT